MVVVAPLGAFSRDPGDLFLFCDDDNHNKEADAAAAENAPPPSASASAIMTVVVQRRSGDTQQQKKAPCARQRQPVQYAGPRLRVGMGPFRAGQRCHAASVDWVRGTVRLYDSSQDLINQVPRYCSAGANALPETDPAETATYVREAFAFLLRGHSLFHPQCRCAPPCNYNDGREGSARTAHLGMDRDGFLREREAGRLTHMGRACPAGSSGAARSVRELESELGVRSLSGEVVWLPPSSTTDMDPHRGLGGGGGGGKRRRIILTARRLPLLRVLVELAGLVPVRDAQQAVVALWSPVCCVPRPIRSGLDVERAARVLWPRPYVFTPAAHPDVLERREIRQTLERLAQRRSIRMLPADVAGDLAIFWNGYAHLEPTPPPPPGDDNNNDGAEEEHALRTRVWLEQKLRP
jgi:hypothetical protein